MELSDNWVFTHSVKVTSAQQSDQSTNTIKQLTVILKTQTTAAALNT